MITIKKKFQNTIKFDLNSLNQLCPKLSDNWANFVAEASAFCLEYNNHTSATQMKLIGDIDAEVELKWNKLSKKVQNTHADIQDATEDGAVGIACGLINLVSGGKLQVSQRSVKGTGFDYWVGEANSTSLFQNKSKLEVSGIIRGNNREVGYRTTQKIKQSKTSHNNLKSFVIVVEFSKPISEVTENG